jgi:3',5'-cyclic AMP phosphodiesterase CpdA
MVNKLTATGTLSLAIMSDLHCCESQDVPRKSFLVAGSKRTPVGQHLVQSLLALVDKHKLIADVVICPGDLAHQVSQKGMVQAWEHLSEVQRKLGSTLLLPTIGNHDVDSRHNLGPDPFDVARTIHPEFPRPISSDNDMFWGRGFYAAAIEDKAGFIVLNTVIGHHDEPSATRGTFNANAIEALEKHLGAIYGPKQTARANLRIAVMHHHPIVHSTAHFASRDTLEFGDQILDVLGDYGFRFVIHGHRHEPRITRHKSRSVEQLVFAAGSFSAQLDELASRTKNLFHHVELECNGNTTSFSGRIRTWEFVFGVGWQEATTATWIPYEVAINSPRPPVETDDLIRLCAELPDGVMRLADIGMRCPQLLRLLPSEIDYQTEQLRQRGHKLTRDERGQVVEIGKVFKP